MYLAEEYLQQVMDLPVSLPAALIKAANWIVVSSVNVTGTTQLEYSLANLQLIDALKDGIPVDIGNVCTPVDIPLIAESRGLAYLAIAFNYSSATPPSQVQWVGTIDDIIQVNGVGLVSRSETALPLILTNTGIYSWVLVNNTTTLDLRLCVTAQVRIQPKDV